MSLLGQKCIPCEVGGVPLKKEEVDRYSKDVPLWKVSDDLKKITREFKFKDLKE